MDWQSALTRLVGVTAPINQALRSGVVKTAEEAFTNPSLAAARQAVVDELKRRGTIAELIEASAALRRQHEDLACKPELSLSELQQLGVLSGMALALSSEALNQALSEQALFLHAVTQLGPWLARAADCGIVNLPKSAQALGVKVGVAVAGIIKTQI